LILFSRHAREQMIDRGISVRDVEEAIARGSKEMQSPEKVLHHFRYFTVVTKKMEGDDFVITVKPRW
jgi:hypothetical protein